MFKMRSITNSIAIVAVSVLLLSFFVQTMNIVVDVDAQKTSREKACTNPRNTQEKDPKFCARLIVIKNVEGGTASPSDFTISVTSTARDKPSPSTFQGSSSGTTVTLGQGSYEVTETNIPDDYTPSYSSGCSGTISAGQTKTCTITNTFTPPPTGTLIVFKEVVGGTASPSDFTIRVSTPDADSNTASPSEFQGSSSGTEVTIGEGRYVVFEPNMPDDYTDNYSEDCNSTISAGETKECTITNSLSATLTVIKRVVGGTAQASDFDFFVNHRVIINGECRHSGQSGPFPGSEEGFTVEIGTGPEQCGYSVQENFVEGYTRVFSPECFANTAPSPGQSLTCIVTNTFTGT
jgi:hypothetical protein